MVKQHMPPVVACNWDGWERLVQGQRSLGPEKHRSNGQWATHSKQLLTHQLGLVPLDVFQIGRASCMQVSDYCISFINLSETLTTTHQLGLVPLDILQKHCQPCRRELPEWVLHSGAVGGG